MPDLLKNNYLSGCALELVKSVDEIDVIWQRLKEAFGDPKVMMSKKLLELNNSSQLFKSKDPEKIINGLHKVINSMKDLMTLVKNHDIEGKLYDGDALDRIFILLGESRITRWLSQLSDGTPDGKDAWESIIKFLEKEAKIQQQKFMIYGQKEPEKKDAKDG